MSVATRSGIQGCRNSRKNVSTSVQTRLSSGSFSAVQRHKDGGPRSEKVGSSGRTARCSDEPEAGTSGERAATSTGHPGGMSDFCCLINNSEAKVHSLVVIKRPVKWF